MLYEVITVTFNSWNSSPSVTLSESGEFTMPSENVAFYGVWDGYYTVRNNFV